MCLVSAVAKGYEDIFYPKRWPTTPPDNWPKEPSVSQFEFDRLKREFDDFRKEAEKMIADLREALEKDKKENQPECSNEEKLDKLEAVAQAAGIDAKDLFDEMRKYHAKPKDKQRSKKANAPRKSRGTKK